MTIANQLTICRIILVPPIVLCIVYARFVEATILFLLAGITDALDGLFARRRGETSRLGMMLDPLADKLLVGATFLALAVPSDALHVTIPAWLVILSIGRDAAILAGVSTFHLAFGPRSFPPSLLGKATTAIHLLVVLYVLAGNVAGFELVGSNALFGLAAALVVMSAIHYAVVGQRVVASVEDERSRTQDSRPEREDAP